MIRINNLSKTYHSNANKTLDNINLHINKGDIFGIVGLSGAGKSTLVRCINRLEDFEEGEIFINDVDISSLDKKKLNKQRKKIGMIFQQFNLFDAKTVYENIAFPLRLVKEKQENIDKRVKQLLEIVELSDKIHSYPSQLSGGQKQRVGIARAIASSPDVLLCDEATSALDPKTTKQILDLLKSINKNTGITIVVITHEMEVIKQICNKVAILDDGKIIKAGKVIDLFSEKSDEATTHFTDYDYNIPPNLDKQRLLFLTFTTKDAQEAIISKISRKLNVDLNIISGSIEYIQDEPLGKLCISIDDKTDKKELIKIFNEYNVRVEEVK